MAIAHDLTGRRYGRLTVIERVANRRGFVRWKCRCKCGSLTEVNAGNLQTGNTRSCGCLGREHHKTHGKSSTRLYKVWSSMKTRCFNPGDRSYYLYGGRGIRVCREWSESFSAFEKWSKAAGYRPGLTIERVDVDGDYSPENCTWIPKGEQSMNTRRCVLLTYNGETKPMRAWADELGVPYARLQGRIFRGWPTELAFVAPPHMKLVTAEALYVAGAGVRA